MEYIISFNSLVVGYYHPLFTDEENEAQDRQFGWSHTQEGHTLRAGLSEFYLVLSPCYNVTLFYCIIIKESN